MKTLKEENLKDGLILSGDVMYDVYKKFSLWVNQMAKLLK